AEEPEAFAAPDDERQAVQRRVLPVLAHEIARLDHDRGLGDSRCGALLGVRWSAMHPDPRRVVARARPILCRGSRGPFEKRRTNGAERARPSIDRMIPHSFHYAELRRLALTHTS